MAKHFYLMNCEDNYPRIKKGMYLYISKHRTDYFRPEGDKNGPKLKRKQM